MNGQLFNTRLLLLKSLFLFLPFKKGVSVGSSNPISSQLCAFKPIQISDLTMNKTLSWLVRGFNATRKYFHLNKSQQASGERGNSQHDNNGSQERVDLLQLKTFSHHSIIKIVHSETPLSFESRSLMTRKRLEICFQKLSTNKCWIIPRAIMRSPWMTNDGYFWNQTCSRKCHFMT